MSRTSWQVVLPVFLAVAGCQFTESSPHQTVYLDPVAIAKALGRDELINRQEEAAASQLSSQLKDISADLARQIEEEKQRLGDKPGQETQQKIDSLTRAANRQLQKTRLVARRKLASFKQQLVGTFRNEILQVAQPIAEEKGATSVAIIDANILWLEPETDITDEVIAGLRARASEPLSTTGAGPIQADSRTSSDSEEMEELNDLVDELENETSVGGTPG